MVVTEEERRERRLFPIAGGGYVALSGEADLSDLRSDLAGELDRRGAPTDTLYHWRAVTVQTQSAREVYIFGRRMSRPVATLTSPVVRLDLTNGLVLTYSKSLYHLADPGTGDLAGQMLTLLIGLIGGAGRPSRSTTSSWPAARASLRCKRCGGAVAVPLGQKGRCECGATVMELDMSGTVSADEGAGVSVSSYIRPMLDAPKDGRPVMVFRGATLHVAVWDAAVQTWVAVDGSGSWSSEELVGWAPWTV